MGDRHRYAQSPGKVADGLCQPGRVEAAGVGDEANTAIMGQAQAFLELA